MLADVHLPLIARRARTRRRPAPGAVRRRGRRRGHRRGGAACGARAHGDAEAGKLEAARPPRCGRRARDEEMRAELESPSSAPPRTPTPPPPRTPRASGARLWPRSAPRARRGAPRASPPCARARSGGVRRRWPQPPRGAPALDRMRRARRLIDGRAAPDVGDGGPGSRHRGAGEAEAPRQADGTRRRGERPPGAAFAARKSADALPWGPGAASAYCGAPAESRCGCVRHPGVAAQVGGGRARPGRTGSPLSRAFGARGEASVDAGERERGRRRRASNRGPRFERQASHRHAEGTTREETRPRRRARRRAVIDSQTARLDELAARDEGGLVAGFVPGDVPGVLLARASHPCVPHAGAAARVPRGRPGDVPGDGPGTLRGRPDRRFRRSTHPSRPRARTRARRIGARWRPRWGHRRLAAPSDLDPAEENEWWAVPRPPRAGGSPAR